MATPHSPLSVHTSLVHDDRSILVVLGGAGERLELSSVANGLQLHVKRPASAAEVAETRQHVAEVRTLLHSAAGAGGVL